MFALRRISVPTHAVVELVGGLALMAAPFLLAFGTAGTLVVFAVGAVLAGLALAAAHEQPVSTHAALDQAVIALTVICALALTLAGDAPAGAVLLAAALGQLTLASATRYSHGARR